MIETRNPFDAGEMFEVLSPGVNNRSFTVHSIKNEDGEYLEKSRKPMALLKIEAPFELKEEDILRRAR